MPVKNLVVFVLLAILTAACAAQPEPIETPVVTQLPASPYPGPQQGRIRSTPTSPYPAPVDGSNIETQEPVQMSASEYQPAPGDNKLTRGVVHLDLESSDILILESFPVQINVSLRGSLPTPCHELRIVPSEPDEDNKINLEVYSLVDPTQNCITVLKPFGATVSLGSFPTGTYSVLVNGEILGEFDA